MAMSEIKKAENGVITKYKSVWNATICVEEEFNSNILTKEEIHDFVNRCGKYSEKKLQKTIEENLSEFFGGKVSVVDFNYNFKEI